jgi:negative regulator of flagellin synthesis FlgM
MGIEISRHNGRPPKEAAEAGKSQATASRNNAASAGSAARSNSSGADKLQLSNQAAQLQALEAEIANLPVVDAQRVQDVRRTLATGSFQIVPARVAHKLLTFEAALGRAG